MDWFFDEWIYGTAVPTYTFAWNVGRQTVGNTRRTANQADRRPGHIRDVRPAAHQVRGGKHWCACRPKVPLTEQTITLPAEAKAMELSPFDLYSRS